MPYQLLSSWLWIIIHTIVANLQIGLWFADYVTPTAQSADHSMLPVQSTDVAQSADQTCPSQARATIATVNVIFVIVVEILVCCLTVTLILYTNWACFLWLEYTRKDPLASSMVPVMAHHVLGHAPLQAFGSGKKMELGNRQHDLQIEQCLLHDFQIEQEVLCDWAVRVIRSADYNPISWSQIMCQF